MATKEHRRGAVKNSQPPNDNPWLELQRILQEMEIDYLPGPAEPPDWYNALEVETGPNPADDEAERRLDGAPETRAQLKQLVELKGRFTNLLPEEARHSWLDMDRAQLLAQFVYAVVHFNVGVDYGRDMALIDEAARRAGIDTSKIDRTKLFKLTHELAQIARQLDSPQDPTPEAKRLAVFLVDDEPAILRGNSRLLRNADVKTAASVAEAKTILASGYCPDVIVSDYNLGDGTGLEILKEAEQRCPGARRYLASGAVAEIPDEAQRLAESVIDKISDEMRDLLARINSSNV